MKTRLYLPWSGLGTTTLLCVAGIAAFLFADSGHPGTPAEPPPAKPVAPAPAKPAPKISYPEIDKLRANAVPGEPMDEPLGGRTLKGTPVTPRTPECFPAESRDLFWRMDMVPDKDGSLHPLNFEKDDQGVTTPAGRDAIRGRNTWVLWGGGNEGFWNWLAQDGFGITDFLVLLDSRTRDTRFRRTGVINQPGFTSNTDPSKRVLGLYLDSPVPEGTKNSELPEPYASTGHVLTAPSWDKGARLASLPADHAKYLRLDPGNGDCSRPGTDAYAQRVIAEQSALFEPGDVALFADTVKKLAAMGDGVDYTVYGFPSGIFGLRLFLNPDFFGKGDYPAKARAYWKQRVEDTHDRYYSDTSITKDPKLVRPFRVSVSCGFCHIGPHPLYPPKNPEKPDWANLSSNIGAQYWKPQPAFGNLQDPNSFLFHFLASQQPGTVDTSLVSTDQINNANTMNAVFDINARLDRGKLNPREKQSAANVQIYERTPVIENPGIVLKHDGTDWINTPRVLVDGSDSIGAFGALARVYLNIGTFYEEWLTCHNAVIGFKPQRPFSVLTCQRNSVYWQTNEKYRARYLAGYFTMKFAPKPGAAPAAGSAPASPTPPQTGFGPATASHNSTQPMKLAAAREADGKTQSSAAKIMLELDTPDQRVHGRNLWLANCAICHSGKQPDDFVLKFAHKSPDATWRDAPARRDNTFLLPMDLADWDDFRLSKSYAGYVSREMGLARADKPLDGDPLTDHHPFWENNFLSNEQRIPVTLVGTNAGRALGTNGIGGMVWDNFSSITYKELPAVGDIDYFNVATGAIGHFNMPGGGRGYYRPATHISLWATAPFLHNNTLGLYLDDPSVTGRLVQFADSIRRVLNKDLRANRTLVLSQKEFDWLKSVQPKETGGAGAGPAYIDPKMEVRRPGDLRGISVSAATDPGFIYRLPNDTNVEFPAAFARPLVEGLVGPFVTSILSFWLWVVIVLWLAWLAWRHLPRYAGITLIVGAVLVAAGLAISGLGGGGSTVGVLLMGASGLLGFSSLQWWWLALVLALLGVTFLQAKPGCNKAARWLLGVLLAGLTYAVYRWTSGWWPTVIAAVIALLLWYKARPTLPGFSRAFFVTLAVLALLLGYVANCFINGRTLATIPIANVEVGPLPVKAGPIPTGTPVNLVMNIDPTSPHFAKGIVSLVLAMAEIKKKGVIGDEAWKIFKDRAAQPLIDASKCPDFVLDHGHLFGEQLLDKGELLSGNANAQAKEDLIAFLKTL